MTIRDFLKQKQPGIPGTDILFRIFGFILMYISLLWFYTHVNVDVEMVLLLSSATLLRDTQFFLINNSRAEKQILNFSYEVNKPQIKILDKDGTRKLETNFTD